MRSTAESGIVRILRRSTVSLAVAITVWFLAGVAVAGRFERDAESRGGHPTSIEFATIGIGPRGDRSPRTDSYPELDRRHERFRIEPHLNSKVFVGTLVLHVVPAADGDLTGSWSGPDAVGAMLAVPARDALSSELLRDPEGLVRSLARPSRYYWSRLAEVPAIPREASRPPARYGCTLSQPEDVPFPRCVSGRLAFPNRK